MLKPQDLKWSGKDSLTRSAFWEGFYLNIQLMDDDSYYVVVAPPREHLQEHMSKRFSSPREAVEWACTTAEELRSTGPGEEYHRRQKLLYALDDCLGIKPGVNG